MHETTGSSSRRSAPIHQHSQQPGPCGSHHVTVSQPKAETEPLGEDGDAAWEALIRCAEGRFFYRTDLLGLLEWCVLVQSSWLR